MPVNKLKGDFAKVLLVEDNHAESRLIKEIFKGFHPECEIVVAHDGVEALEILSELGDSFDLVLLDLNLPKKSGFEVLKEIRQDVNIKDIPVIILSTSDSEKDILLSYEFLANCYITKPVSLDQFVEAVRAVDRFWLEPC